MNSPKRLKFRVILAVIVLLVSSLSLISVTYAWYVYQTSIRTSDIRMAVGTGSSLQISGQYAGEYGTSAVLDEFRGLLNPVSTDRISGGFQKVYGFTNGSENQPRLVASLFGEVDNNDYYKTTLFLRCSGERQGIYLADIAFEDDDPDNPISTAIRLGFVIHEPGENKPVAGEIIAAINTESNPAAQYNTATGQEGYVLDSSKTDGTTIPMHALFTPANYCNYDANTGTVSLGDDSRCLFELTGDENGNFGVPVQVDIYIWLEGCDQDCTSNLCSKMLRNLMISFVGSSDRRGGDGG